MATWLLVAAPAASAALPPGGTFMDDNGSSFEGAIEAIAAEGITSGCDPLSVLFCPTEHVSRAQMAAFLDRALDLPAAPSAGFVDVSGSFAVSIDRLAAAGITRGCNPPANDRFCPAQAVTRAQMAAFLVRALGLTSTGGITFSDVPSSHPFRTDISRLAAAGISSGCGGGRYCPDQAVTREQMAAFLVRALDLDPIVPPPPPPGTRRATRRSPSRLAWPTPRIPTTWSATARPRAAPAPLRRRRRSRRDHHVRLRPRRP